MGDEVKGDAKKGADEQKPRMPVRRFDVFAEYNKQKAMKDGIPEDEAEGYGLWVAKVVASGGGRGARIKAPSRGGAPAKDEPEEKEPEKKSKWHALGGEEQTDEMFEKEIIRRMGSHFYNTVFAPAIEDALNADKSYQQIRDTIRKDWKP
ncbi:MAG TPA: hypothetical protein VM409_08745 [Chloroflexia bacterium]|nr:hypothetical protein [Chloroflexia bacterium]